MEKQPHQDKMHQPKDGFFYHERLCQHVPFFKQIQPPTSMTDACRYAITRLFFPRLVIIRARHVLETLMPILQLDHNGVFGLMLQDVGLVLSPIGWVLHGLRLLINIIELLQAMLSIGINDTDNAQTWHARIEATLQRRGTAIGNDLIWVLAAIAPNNLLFTCVFLMVDILWLTARVGIKMQRLSESRHGIEIIKDSYLMSKIEKKTDEEWHIFLLNLTSLLSINAISIIKNFILPTVFPMLAVNSWLLLVCGLLSLVITISSHLLEKTWVGSNPCDEKQDIPKTTTLSFFGNLHPSNEEDMAQSINLPCAR